MASVSRFSWRLTLVVATALVVTIVARWPLAWTTRWLPAGVTCGAPAGSAWHGHCGALTVNGVALGDTSWRLHPLSLLRGTLALSILTQQGADRIAAELELKPDGRRIARDVTADLTLGTGMLQQASMGLTGRLQARLERAVLRGRRVHDLAGVVTVQHLAQGATPLGNYEVRFPDTPVSGKESTTVKGELRDLGGPIGFTGTIALTDEPGYVIDGLIAARADTPPALARQIAFLGTPDAQGQRPFSIAGTY